MEQGADGIDPVKGSSKVGLLIGIAGTILCFYLIYLFASHLPHGSVPHAAGIAVADWVAFMGWFPFFSAKRRIAAGRVSRARVAGYVAIGTIAALSCGLITLM